jgi:hypothetical protein
LSARQVNRNEPVRRHEDAIRFGGCGLAALKNRTSPTKNAVISCIDELGMIGSHMRAGFLIVVDQQD